MDAAEIWGGDEDLYVTAPYSENYSFEIQDFASHGLFLYNTLEGERAAGGDVFELSFGSQSE